MLPTDILRNEHKFVMMVLAGAENIAHTIDNTGNVDS